MFYVSGFKKNESAALKFEWSLQHPNGLPRGNKRSLGVEGCLKSLLNTATLRHWTKSAPPAKSIPLTIHWRKYYKDFLAKNIQRFPSYISHSYYDEI